METIRKGSRGSDVKYLQSLLHLAEDGIFGPMTQEAVIEFQRQHGLTPDGIVGPKTWFALGIPTQQNQKRNIKEIIVHCSATPEGEDFTVEQIRKMHITRGFSDIGYHYVIYRDGSIHAGRAESISGAHCKNHNTISIGVCYIGGCPPRSVKNWDSQGKDTRTAEQKVSLVELLSELKKKYTTAKIYSHREFANKLCPSFDATNEYRNI